MKRSLLVVTAAVAFMASPAAYANSYIPEESDNPIRIVAYPIHFVGKVVEVTVTRPIHWFVSQPSTRHWFGRVSNPRTDDYTGSRDDYQRSR